MRQGPVALALNFVTTLSLMIVAGSCGNPDQRHTAAQTAPIVTGSLDTSAGAATTVTPTTEPKLTLDLPTGSGPFIDPSLTREEFEQILSKDGYTTDQLIKEDATLIDVRVDVPFVARDQIVGEPRAVELVGGHVMVDGVVVVTYLDGTNACYAPVGGSTDVRNGLVYVAIYSGFKQGGVDECIASTELWRATLVVPAAKYGMAVRQQDGDTTLDGVPAPLIENLRASLIFPEELPAFP
jgi:hypothetical protein